jgi:hypothetical protein
MNGKKTSKVGLVVLLLLVIAAVSILKRLLPALAKGIAFIGTLVVIAAVVLIIAIIISGFTGSGKSSSGNSTSKSVAARNRANLSEEEAAKLKTANQQLAECRITSGRIKDHDVRRAAGPALETADKIVRVLRDQPDEIKGAHQFLNYYLPTLGVIL